MSITDELRECIATAVWQYENDVKTAYIPKDKLTAIADRIDAAYEAALLNVHTDLMDASGWARLPKDADGVPIRVGDEVEFFNGNHDYVRLLALRESGWSVNSLEWNPASLRHHHEPTVEDVLEELLREYDRDDSELTNGEIIERFAAKLRLAGEAE